MPDTVSTTLPVLTHLILTKPFEADTIIAPVLKISKVRLREFKYQHHTMLEQGFKLWQSGSTVLHFML